MKEILLKRGKRIISLLLAVVLTVSMSVQYNVPVMASEGSSIFYLWDFDNAEGPDYENPIAITDEDKDYAFNSDDDTYFYFIATLNESGEIISMNTVDTDGDIPDKSVVVKIEKEKNMDVVWDGMEDSLWVSLQIPTETTFSNITYSYSEMIGANGDELISHMKGTGIRRNEEEVELQVDKDEDSPFLSAVEITGIPYDCKKVKICVENYEYVNYIGSNRYPEIYQLDDVQGIADDVDNIESFIAKYNPEGYEIVPSVDFLESGMLLQRMIISPRTVSIYAEDESTLLGQGEGRLLLPEEIKSMQNCDWKVTWDATEENTAISSQEYVYTYVPVQNSDEKEKKICEVTCSDGVYSVIIPSTTTWNLYIAEKQLEGNVVVNKSFLGEEDATVTRQDLKQLFTSDQYVIATAIKSENVIIGYKLLSGADETQDGETVYLIPKKKTLSIGSWGNTKPSSSLQVTLSTPEDEDCFMPTYEFNKTSEIMNFYAADDSSWGQYGYIDEDKCTRCRIYVDCGDPGSTKNETPDITIAGIPIDAKYILTSSVDIMSCGEGVPLLIGDTVCPSIRRSYIDGKYYYFIENEVPNNLSEETYITCYYEYENGKSSKIITKTFGYNCYKHGTAVYEYDRYDIVPMDTDKAWKLTSFENNPNSEGGIEIHFVESDEVEQKEKEETLNAAPGVCLNAGTKYKLDLTIGDVTFPETECAKQRQELGVIVTYQRDNFRDDISELVKYGEKANYEKRLEEGKYAVSPSDMQKLSSVTEDLTVALSYIPTEKFNVYITGDTENDFTLLGQFGAEVEEIKSTGNHSDEAFACVIKLPNGVNFNTNAAFIGNGDPTYHSATGQMWGIGSVSGQSGSYKSTEVLYKDGSYYIKVPYGNDYHYLNGQEIYQNIVLEKTENPSRVVEYLYTIDKGDALNPETCYKINFLDSGKYNFAYNNAGDMGITSPSYQFTYENGDVVTGTTQTWGNRTCVENGYGYETFDIVTPRLSEGYVWEYVGNEGSIIKFEAKNMDQCNNVPSPKNEDKSEIKVGDVLNSDTDYFIKGAEVNGETLRFSNLFYLASSYYDSNGQAPLTYKLLDGSEIQAPLYVVKGGANGYGSALIHTPQIGHRWVVSDIDYVEVNTWDPSDAVICPAITVVEMHDFEDIIPEETDGLGNTTKYTRACKGHDLQETVYLRAEEKPLTAMEIGGVTMSTEELQAAFEEDIETRLENANMTTIVKDVVLESSNNGSSSWNAVPNEEFPEEGWVVRLDYPTGTNKDDFTFTVAHMLTGDTDSQQAGDIEYPQVTLQEDGIVFTVHSLSPIAISYTERNTNISQLIATYAGGKKVIGSAVNKDELTVTARYEDGTTRVLGKDEYTISPGTILSEGSNNITVTSVEDTSATANVVIIGIKESTSTKKDESPSSPVPQPTANLSAQLPEDKGTVPVGTAVTAPRTSDSKAIFAWLGAVVGGIGAIMAGAILWLRKKHNK